MEPLPTAADLFAARAALARARRVAALTGAGISAESGIPTFRGAGGLWRDWKAEDLAAPDAFARDPRLVWEWYVWRREKVALARPNAGHEALAAFERARPGAGAWTLVTQNIDGLHGRAGSRRPIELHGSIWRVRCVDCGVERTDERTVIDPLPPRCAGCGGIERPAVVWFGEALPEGPWDEAFEACRACDAFLTIGTSAVVYPAAGLIEVAEAAGAVVIEVNPEETAASSHARFALRGPAAEILPRLLAGRARAA
jgi:NAD-dependent deacetylase